MSSELPRFEVVARSRINAGERFVEVQFGTIDRQFYRCEFGIRCLPSLVAQLMARTAELQTQFSSDPTNQIQSVAVIGTTLAMTGEGTAAVGIRLQGGAEIPLEFLPADLLDLRNSIDQALSMTSYRKN